MCKNAHGANVNAESRPVHDVARVPDFLSKSLGSDRVAFSAGILGGIQLSSLPDPRTVREAMAAPDADGWRGPRMSRAPGAATTLLQGASGWMISSVLGRVGNLEH